MEAIWFICLFLYLFNDAVNIANYKVTIVGAVSA